SGLKIW
ncbi:amino ABC transporter, permease, 3-TM region, His/Glu/Gln/Arg/opine family domain protein, partial [Vibrio parahaemolyticus V-223/04]